MLFTEDSAKPTLRIGYRHTAFRRCSMVVLSPTERATLQSDETFNFIDKSRDLRC